MAQRKIEANPLASVQTLRYDSRNFPLSADPLIMLQHAMSFVMHLHDQKSQFGVPSLSQAPSWSFKDPGIQQICRKYLHNARYDPERGDTERPSKRARPSAVNGKNSSSDVRSKIVNGIKDLLGGQEHAKLVSLSQIAVQVTLFPMPHCTVDIDQ